MSCFVVVIRLVLTPCNLVWFVSISVNFLSTRLAACFIYYLTDYVLCVMVEELAAWHFLHI